MFFNRDNQKIQSLQKEVRKLSDDLLRLIEEDGYKRICDYQEVLHLLSNEKKIIEIRSMRERKDFIKGDDIAYNRAIEIKTTYDQTFNHPLEDHYRKSIDRYHEVTGILKKISHHKQGVATITDVEFNVLTTYINSFTAKDRGIPLLMTTLTEKLQEQRSQLQMQPGNP
ncbi:MAG: hypothetical protein ACYCQI_05685 [Gammaproteobacteria bacterium]